VVGEQVAIVDSATATASALAELLSVNALEAPAEEAASGRHVQLTTGDVDGFAVLARRLFGGSFASIEALELRRVAS